MPFGWWTRVGPRKHVLDGFKSQFEGAIEKTKKTCPGISNDTLPSAVQKWPNRSWCRLDCGLGWTEWSMCYIGGQIGATWRIRLNRPFAAAMLPYVKLLWTIFFNFASYTFCWSPLYLTSSLRATINGRHEPCRSCLSIAMYCHCSLFLNKTNDKRDNDIIM